MPALALLLLVMNQPPPSKEAPLSVTFVIAPSLAAPGAPPKLTVTAHNESSKALEWMRFDGDACYAHFFLSLTLTLPDGTKPQAAGCAIRSWPGVKGTLAAGASDARELDLAKLFPGVKWTAGRYGLELGWRPDALDGFFGGAFSWRASQWSVSDDHFVLAPVLSSGRVERGKTLTLPDGAELKFVAHGHKRTMVDGPPSPLIIHGELTPAKGKAAPFEARVQVEESRIFRLPGDLAFELGKYEYDGWMELKYFGKVEK